MDCKVFRKRLIDLIEDNITYDLKDAMLDHIAECEACRAIYEEELSMDETIRKGLSINPSSFKSSRAEIMKNIDKNKYGTNPVKKMLNHLKKYRGTYTSAAAVIAAAIFITPYISRNGLGIGAKKSASFENASSLAKPAAESARDSASLKLEPPKEEARMQGAADTADTADKKQSLAISEVYNASFEKRKLEKGFTPSFNTPWQDSANKKYSATLEGRGYSAEDEGVASIILKDLKTGEQWSFNLMENEMMQMSPRSVYWIDDENLLVVVGLAPGHASLGGNLYMLNVNSSETIIADPENKAKLMNGSVIMKVVSTKILPLEQLEITVQVSVYEDEIKNKYHTENRTIVVPFK
jgi:hypothetical protein